MFHEALHDISKPRIAAILEAVKRSDGLSVTEIAKELDMSYMGVKQHCVNLEKLGYLKPWRVPRSQSGRPEKLYKPTAKVKPLLPQAGVSMTLDILDSAKALFGDAAPEKLLFHHFEVIGQKWKPLVLRGKSLVEKATRLTELRQKQGCFSRCKYSAEEGFIIEEYHHPLAEIFKEYPSGVALELRMMEQLIGCSITRENKRTKRGTQLVKYQIDTLG